MGCGNSNTFNYQSWRQHATLKIEDKESQKLDFLQRHNKYIDLHKRFSDGVMNKAFIDDLCKLEKERDYIAGHMEILYNKHKDIISKAKITKSEFTILIIEIISEKLIKESFKFAQINMHTLFKTYQETKLNLSKDENKIIHNLLSLVESDYPKTQTGLVYFIDNKTEYIKTLGKGIKNIYYIIFLSR